MKTPGDRIDTIEKNLGTLMIKALSLKLELSKGEFREEDHPRADDGKWGDGGGGSSGGSPGRSTGGSGDAVGSSSKNGVTSGKTIFSNSFEEKNGFPAAQLSNLTYAEYINAKANQQKFIDKHGKASLTHQTTIDAYEINHQSEISARQEIYNTMGNHEIGDKIAAQTETSLKNSNSKIIDYGEKSFSDPIVKDYTVEGNEDMNNFLRHPDRFSSEQGSKLSEKTSALTQIIDRSPQLPKNVELYRGVGKKTGESLINAKLGDTCNDAGFQSFSTNPATASGFSTHTPEGRVVLRAITTGGVKGIYLTGGRENEVLIQKGTKWKIADKEIGVQYGQKTHIITVVPYL